MAADIAGARKTPWLLLSPSLATISLLLIVPMLFIVVYSFWLRTATGADQVGFYLDNWIEVLGDRFYRDILFQTLLIAFYTTVICALVGYIPAYFVANTRMNSKAFLLLLLMLPFWISYIIRTMSWINILGTSGALNTLLMSIGIIDDPIQMLYNQQTVVLGLVHYLLPFMILNVYVSLDGIDKNLTEAAKSLGCTGFQAFREVTLPLSLPGLAAGSLLCFVLAAGTYITPIVLGGPRDAMFANLVFEAIVTQLNWPLGSALSLVLLALLGALVVIYTRYLGIDQIAKSFK
ncbi:MULTISPECIES: ABC transporter permease [Thalassospira]|jgi:spermidine/putrescine transport system permease protein|uniref:ABC transporter permease n=1 Tax=Thalassospira profundimaris TaxID=502049 RepID=A0A367V312_9PROT|nr:MULTISPECIES: ABC transporter permease [Thalassospira]MBR9899908.1 ABC transporter permease [Rhodospirillales bacterium]KZB72716.1 ABC transporter permease [Thalassospira sp. MCCC 1A01148]MBO6807007.1 ABC transporter permease [Thalassospira sp.]MBO6841521.1 ABC transporter permease [Thalassospira sp.]MBS8273023.1 ABC transporter permease [Thalassospira tepidiphila]